MDFEKKEPTKEDIEFAKKAHDDMEWLNFICKKPPNMADLEKVVNTLGILQDVNPYLSKMEVNDRLILGLVGHIVKVARESDDKKFGDVSAWAYIQLAYSWFTAEKGSDQEEYIKFVQRISGG